MTGSHWLLGVSDWESFSPGVIHSYDTGSSSCGEPWRCVAGSGEAKHGGPPETHGADGCDADDFGRIDTPALAIQDTWKT